MILIVHAALELGHRLAVVILETVIRPVPPGLAEIIVLHRLICCDIRCPGILFQELIDFLERLGIASVKSLPEHLISRGPQVIVIYPPFVLRILRINNFVRREQSSLHKPSRVYEQPVPGKRREALIRRITHSRKRERKHLPVSHSLSGKLLRECYCLLAKYSDPERTGKRTDMHKHSTTASHLYSLSFLYIIIWLFQVR